MENNHRLARKYFKCNKCKNLESQLIHPNQFQIKCSSCGIFLSEIPEKEYKILKKNKNYNINKSNIGHNNDSPYRPNEDAFRNISSVYNRPPSNTRRQQNNLNENNRNNRFSNNNINNHNHNNNQRRNNRYQSTSHYSDMNIVNNDHNQNNNNINNNNINNERERRYGQGARNRSGSQEPSHFLDNLFNNMFGLFPLMNASPIIISQSGEGPYRIFVQSQNVPQNIFDPIFLAFGAMFDNSFRNNFSSNFRSNFRGNFLSEIIRIIERNQEEAARKAHPPTSESALKKLKRFYLNEKYCKKDKKGKLELPSCCICLNDIELKEETVLLPCGHMFHWNCCLSWLKQNNTCPMCRFVLKD